VPFLSRDLTLAPGDACVVRTDRGLEYGVCMAAPAALPEDAPKKPTMSVVRKANYNDEHTYRQIFMDEEKARDICARRILESGLPMQLVDVEYAFDRRRAVFYFTAEDRVDFRKLVRDLAHDLKTRIELRHIQVRDKAKLVGGLAACGRELCCAAWMDDFMPISMKMAKRQNLSLNPGKISGQCGRLMCCLSYENHQYEDKKKQRKPREGAPAPERAQPRGGDETGGEDGAAAAPGSATPVAAPDKPLEETPAAVTKGAGPGEKAAAPRPAGREADTRKPRRPRRRKRRRSSQSKPGGGGARKS